MGDGAAVRMLVAICLASGGWSLSFGLGSQVVTLWLHNAGASNAIIGFNHATYYLGLTLGSLLAPRLIQRWNLTCAVLGLVVSALSLAVFPWTGGLTGWFSCRFLSGFAGALTLIPLETLLSRSSAPGQRSRNFAFYGVSLTLGGAIGIWLGLHFFQPGDTLPFLVGAGIPLVAALLVWLMPALQLVADNAVTGSLEWTRNFLSFATGWCQGFLEGGMLAFLSLYLVSLGMSADSAGSLMGLTMVGVILFQVPVGGLADRLGRLPVLLGCYALVIAGLILVPYCQSTFWVAAWLFLLGAASGALYPLGLALLGDRVPENSLVRAYSWFLALECLGSQMGAAAMGQARDLWGEASMFAVGVAAVGLVLVLAGISHCLRRPHDSPASHIKKITSRAA